MKSVYIDESGYTGADLLNQEQPYQGASAIYISDSEAAGLIEKHFKVRQSEELKYRTLVKSKRNREKLLCLQEEILSDYCCIGYVCNKRFLLILLFVDFAVEPLYHDCNIDFYEDGLNYSLAQLLYFTGDTILKGDNFRDILFLFQSAIKSKSAVAISALIEKVKASPWNAMKVAFGPLAYETRSCIESIKHKNASTDISSIVFLSLVSRLESVINDQYSIIHDESENLRRYDMLFQKMINHDLEASFKVTELTTMNFPLKLCNVSQIDSKVSPGVQLADILIGGLMDAAKALSGIRINEYNKEIIRLYRDDQLIHLLPSLDFSKEKQFRRGTQNKEFISYCSKFFSE